jgi:hypothetical protein
MSAADLDELPVGGGSGMKLPPAAAEQAAAPGQPERATLTEAQRTAMGAALEAFGEDCMARLVSKPWQLKDAAIADILKSVADGMRGVAPPTACEALAQVLRQLGGVKLKKIVTRRLELTGAVIRAVLPALSSASAGGGAAVHLVAEVVTTLLPYCGEADASSRQQAQGLMLSLLTGPSAATAREAGAVARCLAPQPKAAAPRQTVGMLELATRLVREHGLADAGSPGSPANLAEVMALASPLLRNARAEIRTAALETVAQCHQRAGRKALGLAGVDAATEGALAKALEAACAAAAAAASVGGGTAAGATVTLSPGRRQGRGRAAPAGGGGAPGLTAAGAKGRGGRGATGRGRGVNGGAGRGRGRK